MAVTYTGEQVLQAVLQRSDLGTTLLNAEIGSLAAGSVTSVLHLRNGNWSTNHFRDLGGTLFRPGNATGMADYQRAVGDLAPSTGALSNDANWSDTTIGTENLYIFKHDLAGRDFLNAFTRALKLGYVRNSEPLSLAADAGFQSTATTDYTESDADGGPATTFTKVTTSAEGAVFGAAAASGKVLNAAANGYIRQRFNVQRGEEVYVGWLVRADTGTGCSLVLYDTTNSAELGAAVSTTEEQWQYLWRRESVRTGATGTETLEVRLQGADANEDFRNSGLWVYRTQDHRIRLSSTWDTAFRMPSLSYGKFDGASNSSNAINAFSMRLTEIPKDQYSFDIQRAGANPNWIHFHDNRWFQYPIWIEGRRALSDFTTPTLALTETTPSDLDLITALTWRELMKQEARNIPGAKALLDEANLMLRAAEARLEDESPEEKVEYWSYRTR